MSSEDPSTSLSAVQLSNFALEVPSESVTQYPTSTDEQTAQQPNSLLGSHRKAHMSFYTGSSPTASRNRSQGSKKKSLISDRPTRSKWTNSEPKPVSSVEEELPDITVTDLTLDHGAYRFDPDMQAQMSLSVSQAISEIIKKHGRMRFAQRRGYILESPSTSGEAGSQVYSKVILYFPTETSSAAGSTSTGWELPKEDREARGKNGSGFQAEMSAGGKMFAFVCMEHEGRGTATAGSSTPTDAEKKTVELASRTDQSANGTRMPFATSLNFDLSRDKDGLCCPTPYIHQGLRFFSNPFARRCQYQSFSRLLTKAQARRRCSAWLSEQDLIILRDSVLPLIITHEPMTKG